MINKTIIQGRLTRDAELRSTTAGKSVASFTVAWSETFNNTERKLFLPCVAWGKTGEFIYKFFKKGAEIALEGKLTSRKWTDRDGNSRETMELNVETAHFCGKRETPVREETPLEEVQMGYADFEELTDDEPLPF